MKLYVLVLLAFLIVGTAAGNETVHVGMRLDGGWAADYALHEADRIESINVAIENADAGWVAGDTGISPEMWNQSSADIMLRPGGAMETKAVLKHDGAFDWRDMGVVTPVRSQGSCGSCWAFGAVAAAEAAFMKYSNNELDLSEQQLVSDCCDAGDCDGGWPDLALEYLRDVGIPTESSRPYEAGNSDCIESSNPYQILDFVYVPASTDSFKTALKKYGPMSVVVCVPEDWYYYRSGIYEPVQNFGWANHVVLLTGWDDADGCWIVKNCWGEQWGENGYARVKYGDLEQYNYAHAVTGVIQSGSAQTDTWVKPWTAQASSNHSDTYAPGKAIDNRTNTHWFSDYADRNPWISFALMEPAYISKVRLATYHKDLPTTIMIETSGGREDWHVANVCTIENSPQVIEFPPVMSRFVRMTQTERVRGWSTCSEFDMWIESEPDPTPKPESAITICYENRTETVPIELSVQNVSVWLDGLLAIKWHNI